MASSVDEVVVVVVEEPPSLRPPSREGNASRFFSFIYAPPLDNCFSTCRGADDTETCADCG
jgi:hypothetical protein